MKPPVFNYEKPETVDGLIAALARYGDAAKILAGGQSLVPMMNFRLTAPSVLIDINGLEDLDYVRIANGKLQIGALARHTTLCQSAEVAENCPLMAEAYAFVGHKPIRNRGTLGGNLSHADPSSEMPAVMVCLEATFALCGQDGTRRVPASEFFQGPLETALDPSEFLAEIELDCHDGKEGWSFQEVSPRKGDFATAAVAATMTMDSGVSRTVRIAHAGVAGHASRAPAAEAMLADKQLDDGLIAEAAEMIASSAEPAVLNYHGDDAYKRDLLRALSQRALKQARERCAR